VRRAGAGPSEADIVRLLRRLAGLDEAALARFLKGLASPVQRFLYELWAWQAHGGQGEPPGRWRQWLLQAGRGFGKTRAGAEWIQARARETPGAQIALVSATIDEAVRVMIEGPSGLLATARTGEEPLWRVSDKGFFFASGARAFLYSGEKPSRLRGPEHDFAWCDELAKWARPDSTWDMLRFGLRRGERPRAVVTTTPRPIALVKRIVGLNGTIVTRGRTIENVHLSDDYIEAVEEAYGGTTLGRQELDGELIEDLAGALWPRELIEGSRVEAGDRPLERILVGVDPPGGTDGDACGIVVCGAEDEGMGYVLADLSAAGLSPEGWARKVAGAAEAWRAHLVVAEANNGGKMVAAVLRGANVSLPIRLVHASEGKAARAEPVAALFESGRVKLAGRFPELEDELAGLCRGGAYQGPGRSPDRADAMVWALTELMLGRGPRGPRIRML